MNQKYPIGGLASTVATTAKVTIMLFLLTLTGCSDDGKYNVILAVDAKEYRSAMKWDEIRESSFKKPYNVRVFDSEGHPVRLYRYNHDDGSIMPEESAEIHISTPIIIEKKYSAILLAVVYHGAEVMKVPVVIRDLGPVKGGSKACVLPIELPSKHQ